MTRGITVLCCVGVGLVCHWGFNLWARPMGRRSVVGEHVKVVYLVTFSLHGRGLYDLLNNNSAHFFIHIYS